MTPDPESIWTKDCVVCGVHALIARSYMHYMVKDSVWEEAGFLPDNIACLPCLEKKLGRELTILDFTDAKINNSIKWALKKSSNHVRNP